MDLERICFSFKILFVRRNTITELACCKEFVNLLRTVKSRLIMVIGLSGVQFGL